MTPQAFTLRDARPGDEAIVARFVRELAEYEKMADQVTATAADFNAALFGPRPVAYAMIAEADDMPVGFALWFYQFSTFTGRPGLYLEDIFVAPSHRGRGAGKMLFRALARRALKDGCDRLQWWVLNWNAPSIAFYRSLGAVPMDEWTVQRISGDALHALASG